MHTASEDLRSDQRVVFVTRRFPPSVGGMETLAADVHEALRRRGGVELIALRPRSLVHLGWFLPWAALRTAISLARGDVERVICGDAITWIAVSPIARLARARSAVMVLGLDLTFPPKIYQRLVRRTLRHADRVVAIRSAAAAAAVERGVEAARVRIVHPGIRIPPPLDSNERAERRTRLVTKLGIDQDALVVVLLGRLVRRKGVAWFVESVIPHLPAGIVYLIVGDGPMEANVRAAAARVGPDADIRMLGRVDDDDRELLLSGSDVAVMANIPVPGDMEGFGLVAVEAACRGAVVVAARIDGLAEAVVDGVTGILLEPEHGESFAAALRSLHAERDELRRLSREFQQNAIALNSIDRMAAELPAALGLEPSRS